MKITSFLFCSFLMFQFLLSFSFAADKDWTFDPKTSTLIPKYLGKVKVVHGKAVIGDRELKKGSRIYNDELVETHDKSFVVIEMIDLTVITLGPKSEFKIEKWDYKTKNDRSALFNVIKGQWRAFIREKAKEADQLKIKTSLVSMGVRGTELLVNVEEKEKSSLTQVALLDGLIRLDGELPADLKRDMVAGDYAIIEKSADGTTHKARILSREELLSFKEFIAPDVPKLLELIALNTAAQAQTNESSDQKKNQSNMPAHKGKKNQPKSLQENLKILNNTREKNLKSK